LQVFDWQLIIEQHGQLVWNTAYRLLGNHADAADCFQDTFVAALQLTRREPVRNLPALLSRLATTRAIDRLRYESRRNRDRAQRDCDQQTRADDPGPPQHACAAELAEQLRAALAKLPDREAKAFCLRYLNDMSYRQVAKQLNISCGAAGVLLHRARARLRTQMDTQKATER